jgi:hypothetical protein
MWLLLTVFPQNMATFAKQNLKKPFVQFVHDFHLSSRCENSLERNTDGMPMQIVEFVSEGW